MTNKLRVPLWNDVLVATSNCSERGRYSENLNRRTKASRSYLTTIIKNLREHDLVTIDHGGRIKRLNLTEKGEKVAQAVQQLKWNLNISY